MKHNSQQGSAHVVVTICLVIALIFALGWIFWQNFVHKEAVKKDTNLIVVDKSKGKDDSIEKTTEDRTLPISNWGVEIPLAADSSQFELAKIEDNPDAMEVKANVTGCLGTDGQAIMSPRMTDVGIVVRYVADEQAVGMTGPTGKTWKEFLGDNGTQVGSYVYKLTTPQQGCADPQTAIGRKANTNQENLTKEFTGLLKAIRTSK